MAGSGWARAAFSASSARVEQQPRLGAILGRDGHTDVGSGRRQGAVQRQRLRDEGRQSLGQAQRVGRLAQRGLDHREAVAAEPAHHILPPDGAAQPAGDQPQHLVAAGAAQRVVHRVEVAQVDHQHPDPPALAGG
jgi:hypothetical protein